MPSRAGPLRSLPWPGVENCHCEEASSKRGHSASPRPRLVPCACPAPTASPAASGSSYRSASDGVRQRPAAAAAEARASGSCTAASSRVRPRSTASRALAAPVKFREVILGLGAPVVASWHLLDHARRGSAGEPRSWQSRSIGACLHQIASDSFHRTKTPAYTVASTHASALPTSRAHRSTCVQKNPRAKP